MHSILPLALLSFCFFGLIHSLNNGLALTPPMGWMTWQRFRCNTDCDTDPLHCIRSIFPFYFFLLKHPFLKISEKEDKGSKITFLDPNYYFVNPKIKVI